MVGAWLVSLVGVVFWERRDTARPASAIVVLGAAQYVGRPSPVLRARIDHAIDLWRRGLAPRIIFTGGFGDRDTTSEAAVGQRYAIEHGVPPRDILIENSGRSTAESLQQVADADGGGAVARRDSRERSVSHAAAVDSRAAIRNDAVHVAHAHESDLARAGASRGSTCSRSRSRFRSRSCWSGASSGDRRRRASARASHDQ